MCSAFSVNNDLTGTWPSILNVWFTGDLLPYKSTSENCQQNVSATKIHYFQNCKTITKIYFLRKKKNLQGKTFFVVIHVWNVLKDNLAELIYDQIAQVYRIQINLFVIPIKFQNFQNLVMFFVNLLLYLLVILMIRHNLFYLHYCHRSDLIILKQKKNCKCFGISKIKNLLVKINW